MLEDELTDVEVALHEFHDNVHRNKGHHAGFKSHGCGLVVLLGKIGAVSEDADGFDDAYDLISSADSILENLYLALNEEHHFAGAVEFVVDNLILAKLFYGDILSK